MMENLETMTNYDMIELLKKNISHNKTRNTFEGSAILTIPLILSMDNIIKMDADYYTDPQYKLKTSSMIRNYLSENSEKNFDQLNTLINENIKILDSTPIISSKIKNAHESLYFMSLKISNNMPSGNLKKEFCNILGQQIEKRFKKFYVNKGYTTDKNLPRNMNKYLRSEFEFFTRIANDIYQKLR